MSDLTQTTPSIDDTLTIRTIDHHHELRALQLEVVASLPRGRTSSGWTATHSAAGPGSGIWSIHKPGEVGSAPELYAQTSEAFGTNYCPRRLPSDRGFGNQSTANSDDGPIDLESLYVVPCGPQTITITSTKSKVTPTSSNAPIDSPSMTISIWEHDWKDKVKAWARCMWLVADPSIHVDDIGTSAWKDVENTIHVTNMTTFNQALDCIQTTMKNMKVASTTTLKLGCATVYRTKWSNNMPVWVALGPQPVTPEEEL